MPQHTSQAFERELSLLRDRLAVMGARATLQLTNAFAALAERADSVAREVVASDNELDRDEREIDELARQILATRQPVASDLRLIAMAFKIVVDLERIGDLASGIAKRALELNQLPPLELRTDLTSLARLVQQNFRAALTAFAENDAVAARAVIAADAEIDRLNATTFAVLLAHVAAEPTTINRVLALTSVCRYLERIGDHVKNLAEDVISINAGVRR